MKAKQLFLTLTPSIFMLSISGCSSVSEVQPVSLSEDTLITTDGVGLRFIATQTTAMASQSGPSDPLELGTFLDAYFAEQMETHHIPELVFIMVKDGKVFFSKGYGYADIETQTPFDPEETVLTTASLAKGFTAVGVLQLYERGLIDLNEDIRPYFKDFQLDTRFSEPLTFANLLTHTDGFETRLIGVAGQTEAELLPLGELLETYLPTQIYPPGEYMTYSDYAANLAGYLIQEISGIPYEHYIAENIFTPLGMKDSTLDLHLPEELRARMAMGYEYQKDRQERVPIMFPRYAPSGGLRTTAADMNRFMLALLNGEEYQEGYILEQGTTQLMFTRQFTPCPKLGGISYGFFEHLENGQQAFLRDGDGVGTRSRVVLFPDHDMGFFLSYNPGDSNLRLDIINDFLDHYYPVNDSNSPTPIEDFRERSSWFTCTYRIRHADTTTFSKSMYFFAQIIDIRASNEGYLIIEPTSGGDSFGGFEGVSWWVEVEPLYFERVDGKGQIAFIQDEDGHINNMVSGQGYQGTFIKLPWHETQGFHMVLIELVALFLFSMVTSTFFVWPLGALIRKLRKRSDQNPMPWDAILAWLWAAITRLLFVLFTFWVIGVLYAINAVAGVPNFVWGINKDMVNALSNMYLPAILALPLPVFTILAWIKGWWKISHRVYYTLVTLAVFAGLWWSHCWNLLGFRY